MACRTIHAALTLLYLGALAGYAAGTYGWLDVPVEQPAAVLLIVFGMPWVLVPFDLLVGQALWPIAALAAPMVNLVILRVICGRRAT